MLTANEQLKPMCVRVEWLEQQARCDSWLCVPAKCVQAILLDLDRGTKNTVGRLRFGDALQCRSAPTGKGHTEAYADVQQFSLCSMLTSIRTFLAAMH